MFLLIGESGEYEQRYETILGLFSAREEAEAAVSEYVERSERERAARQSFDAKVEAIVVARGFPKGEPFRWDNKRYEEEVRVRAELGGQPDFIYFPERYEVIELPVGELLSIRPEYPNERPKVRAARSVG